MSGGPVGAGGSLGCAWHLNIPVPGSIRGARCLCLCVADMLGTAVALRLLIHAASCYRGPSVHALFSVLGGWDVSGTLCPHSGDLPPRPACVFVYIWVSGRDCSEAGGRGQLCPWSGVPWGAPQPELLPCSRDLCLTTPPHKIFPRDLPGLPELIGTRFFATGDSWAALIGRGLGEGGSLVSALWGLFCSKLMETGS